MDLYKLMTNIQNISYEDEIIRTIAKIKRDLQDLTEERTCKIYSGHIYADLKAKHIPARIINTLDLGGHYEHEFILVPSNEKEKYYIVDLTFLQFPNNLEFNFLLQNGYILADNSILSAYLDVISPNLKGMVFRPSDVYYLESNDKINNVRT